MSLNGNPCFVVFLDEQKILTFQLFASSLGSVAKSFHHQTTKTILELAQLISQRFRVDKSVSEARKCEKNISYYKWGRNNRIMNENTLKI